MRFGLEENIIKKITEVFEKNPKVDKAFIFGSRAKGNFRPDSDIDIAIKGYGISLDDIIKMSSAFDDNNIKYKIDLVDYNSIKEKDLKEHIDRVGIEFYSRWQSSLLQNITQPKKEIYSPNKSEQLAYIGLEHIEPEMLRLNSIGASSEVTSSKFRFKSNDILFGKLRPYFRKVVKPEFDGICSTDIWVFNAKTGFDQNFLFYFLANWDFVNTADGGESGTRMPRADWNYLKDTRWKVPPLSDQTAIAEVLSSLDDKIDLLRRQNRTLEKLAETLFKNLLEEKKGKWQLKPLGSLVETTYGGEWGKENAENDFTFQVSCIRGTDIADLNTGLADRTPVRFVKEKKYYNIQPKDGDLILEISGGTDNQSTGRTIYINELNKGLFPHPVIFSNFCRLLRPMNNCFTYFLYLYFQYLYDNGEFFNLENGSSGIKNLDYKFLLFDLEYPLPTDKQDIINFNNQVEIYFNKINKNKHQIKLFIKLRNTLLPKLMSGEVRVMI